MKQSTFYFDIEKFADKLYGRGRTFARKLCMDIDRGVVLSTPVRTGRARGGWLVGLNLINDTPTIEDETGQATIDENNREINKLILGDIVYISNNVNYVQFLERGSSKQAPNGMVAKTLRRFPQILREAVVEAKKEHP